MLYRYTITPTIANRAATTNATGPAAAAIAAPTASSEPPAPNAATTPDTPPAIALMPEIAPPIPAIRPEMGPRAATKAATAAITRNSAVASSGFCCAHAPNCSTSGPMFCPSHSIAFFKPSARIGITASRASFKPLKIGASASRAAPNTGKKCSAMLPMMLASEPRISPSGPECSESSAMPFEIPSTASRIPVWNAGVETASVTSLTQELMVSEILPMT